MHCSGEPWARSGRRSTCPRRMNATGAGSAASTSWSLRASTARRPQPRCRPAAGPWWACLSCLEVLQGCVRRGVEGKRERGGGKGVDGPGQATGTTGSSSRRRTSGRVRAGLLRATVRGSSRPHVDGHARNTSSDHRRERESAHRDLPGGQRRGRLGEGAKEREGESESCKRRPAAAATRARRGRRGPAND